MDISARLFERQTRLGLITGLSLVSIVALFFLPPLPLAADYHSFADGRTLLGIPNCFNVLSNIPFIVAGVLGLAWLLHPSSNSSFMFPSERLPYFIFFTGVTLTGFGSLWYHLDPNDERLPWDLLPMTCCFTAMISAVVMERISVSAGRTLLLPLLVLGIASVAYWYATEAHGHGDYRFYLFVQFYSPVLLAGIIALFPPRYTHIHYLVGAFVLFVLAKLFELFDRQIYSSTQVISGHTLKHITAGIACYWILLMLQRRRPIQPLHGPSSLGRFL
jgi:hypothetical protein